MIRGILPRLIALECAGLIRTRETEDGWKVARKEGEGPQHHCLMLRDGTWTCKKPEAKGAGVLSMARHLGLGDEVMEFV